MFTKNGEAVEISSIESVESCVPIVSQDILDNFQKFAANLKKIAPKAEDFLYFSAIFMHAAEASAINDDGSPKLTYSGEPVKVGWDTSNGTWRWTSNDKNVKPYKNSNCFIPGTSILLEDGSLKNIEDVEIGDKVITHKGRVRKVTNKFITPCNDKIVKLKISNNESISCTSNHPFYIARNNTKDSNYKRVLKNNKASFTFVEANSLNKTDHLLCPIVDQKFDSNLNSNKARILGLYAAEGCLLKDKIVNFSFGEHEKDNLVQECANLIKNEYLDSKIKIYSKLNTCSLSVTSKQLFKDCLQHVGKYSSKKTLSKELVFSNNEVKSNFILGWMEGDGNVDKQSGKLVGTTVSKNMASQIRVMLHGLNISNSFYKVKPSVSKSIVGKYPIYRIKISYNNAKNIFASNKLVFNKKCLNRKPNSFNNNYRLYSLLEKEYVSYSGNVYNIEVEDDHSYIANGIAVHNCDIFPEQELIKAHKKWIGKPLCIDHKSSSVDHVRGFIVDTYYDRKLKRVVGLCALDKHNYPDLARKVATGYSNNVSMGTGVGKAICSDCGRVARIESDFCEHMRNKSCYGEINTELNPIELSIVVNGADPKAHIKHIIAAANTLNNYVETKEKELKKLAVTYSVSLSVATDVDGQENVNTANFDLKSSDLETLKSDVDAAFGKLKEINESFQNSGKDLVSDQSSETVAMDETVLPSTDSVLAPPHARFASTNVDADLIAEFKKVTVSIEDKLSQMQQSLEKLANASINTQEENMSGSNINKQGYFQGGGGENEPSPGQPKYTKDPTNEKLREDGDKHMLADDTGPVEGMHPGPDSVGMSELERKKMLARAEAEERALRRNAVVNMAKQALEQKKEAYFHAGDKNPQEPTPGKTKYAPDKLNEQLREDSDKQMVGQKPFPGVGSVDGLHPSPSSADVSDEKKRKEMLNRASLKARFVKAANEDGTLNFGDSAWEVFQGDKLLLTASVNELSGGRSDILYDSIATKEFGTKLIEKVKVQGADKVRSLVKSAQPKVDAPSAAPEVAPVPEAAPQQVSEPEAPKDTGKAGDPKETALELSEKIRDLSSDLVEAIRALTGEQAEMGSEEAVPESMGATASDTATLGMLRKELNSSLINAMKEAVADLKDHEQELEMINGMYNKGAINDANKDFAGAIVEDALTEIKSAVADGFKLMTAFVKYARGTKTIMKRAEIEAELEALAAEGETMTTSTDTQPDNDLAALVDETDADLKSVEDMLKDEDANDMKDDSSLEGLLESLEKDDLVKDDLVKDDAAELELADDNDALTVKKEDLPKLSDAGVEVKLATLEDRAALRAKLAAETLKTSPHLHEAHPKGSFTTDLDVKPTGNLAAVEDLEDEHKAMMDVATAPPKVRKEAETIHKFVSEGKLDPKDLDALVAEGLDKDAVAYYKKYFGQVDGGSEFASELIKEHVKAQLEEELDKYRVKLARAYELAYDMVDRGLCYRDRTAISSQVDEIMKFNDDSFDSLKRVVAKHSLNKEASHMPRVGLIGSEDISSRSSTEENLVDQLSAILSTNSRKMF